jgi:hypothetical protein
LRGQGLGDVRFALRRPGRFRLMFRDGVLHPDADLQCQANAAFEALAAGVYRAAGGAGRHAGRALPGQRRSQSLTITCRGTV